MLDKDIVTNETFTATLLMAVASTMLSIPMVTPQLAKKKALIFQKPDYVSREPLPNAKRLHVRET